MPVRTATKTELYQAGEPLPTRDRWMETLAWLMDSSIPIGPWSIGLDSMIGLIPGFGDLAGAVVSLLIVLRAMQAGVPRVAIARMMSNIVIDSVLGSIPVGGDLFDMAYKSNMKNLRIYEESLARGHRGNRRHWIFFLAVVIVVAVVVSAPAALAYYLLR